MDEYHKFACILAIEAGQYLRQQALARASRRGQPQYDLELTIKENAAVNIYSFNTISRSITLYRSFP